MTTADVSCDYNRVLVLGLGEYLALQGEAKTREYLASLSDLNLGTGKAVILLRGMTEQLRILLTEDVRRRESGCIEIASHASTNISLELAEPELGIYELRGLKFFAASLGRGSDWPGQGLHIHDLPAFPAEYQIGQTFLRSYSQASLNGRDNQGLRHRRFVEQIAGRVET